MSDSATPKSIPPLDQRLQAVFQTWEQARASGHTLTIDELCDDSHLADALRSYIDARKNGDSSEIEDSSDEYATVDCIGPFTVLRHLGQGGSSNIFLCEQTNPHRQVALKLLKISHCKDRHQRRFQLEIDLLATLEHPAIARIFDAGIADIGRGPQPYYTMEYVKGLRLDHFLQSRTEEEIVCEDRIRLFLRIANAVGYAHEHGIIHRDLKPSNILITESGSVKVIDFGLARLSDSDATIAGVTKTGHFVGTPLYMSPEQFTDGKQLADDRSDIYSLGVVLYQMLVGRLPYDLEEKTLFDIANTVTQVEPEPLRKVDSRFHGDLDVIVMKTLSKEPANRYQSVSALVEDLECYLDGRAISAKRPSAMDPIVRWCSRNRAIAVLGAASAFLLLVSFVVALLSTATARRRAEELQVVLTRLTRAYVRVEQESVSATRKSADLELAVTELKDATERMQRSTANATLMRTVMSTETNPSLTQSLLFDTNLIPEQQRGFAWNIVERQSNWQQIAGRWERGPVLDAVFSGDGSLIAAAAVGGIEVRRADDLSLSWSLSEKIVHPTLLALDPAGHRLVYAKADQGAFLFDQRSESKKQLTTAEKGRPKSIAWSQTGQLAIGFGDGTVHLWKDSLDDPPAEFRIGEKQVVGMQFHPDESLLATATFDGIIQMIDLIDGAIEESIPLGVRGMQRAVFSSDCRYVTGGRRFHYVKAWDLREASVILNEPNPGPFVTCAIANQRTVRFGLSTRGRTELIRPDLESVFLSRSKTPIRTLTFSPDGTLLLTGDGEGNLVIFRTVQQTVPRPIRVSDSAVKYVRFADDSETIAVCGSEGSIETYRVSNGELIASLPPSTKAIVDVEIGGCGTELYWSLTDGTLDSWNFDQRVKGRFRRKSERRIVDFALSDDELQLFAVTVRGQLAVHDLESGQLRVRQTDHDQKCSAMILSNDSRMIFTADEGGGIIAWDSSTLEPFAEAAAGETRIHELSIGVNGKFLAAASSDGQVHVLEGTSLLPVAELIVHTSAVRTLHFSPDGATLATGGMDGRVILWDTVVWQPQIAWDIQGSGVRSVRFSPDGKKLAIGGNHNEVTLWESGPTQH